MPCRAWGENVQPRLGGVPSPTDSLPAGSLVFCNVDRLTRTPNRPVIPSRPADFRVVLYPCASRFGRSAEAVKAELFVVRNLRKSVRNREHRPTSARCGDPLVPPEREATLEIALHGKRVGFHEPSAIRILRREEKGNTPRIGGIGWRDARKV